MIMRPISWSQPALRGDRVRAGRLLATIYGVWVALIVSQMIQSLRADPLQPSAADANQQQEQQQQQQQRRQQQQLAANGGGQAFGDFSSSALADSMINLGGGQPNGYLNTKRARKMSAFMPMRGRKDGRDYQYGPGAASGWQPAVEGPVGYLAGPMRESDESDASILRLAMAAAAANQAFGATPRSFVDQLAARRVLQQQQQQQQSQSQPGAGGEVVAFESGSSNGFLLDPASLAPPQNTVMQAKLRRAFHPMRGKKFDPTAELFGELDSEM